MEIHTIGIARAVMEAIGPVSIRPPSHFPAFAECFSTK
jgi:hypothetical protein